MQDKQKVTFYLPPQLHRQLKIKAAVETEPMSAIAERALVFYLSHPELIDEHEAVHGDVHRVYSCPDCSSSYVIRDGELVSLSDQVGVLDDGEDVPLAVPSTPRSHPDWQGEEELVPC